jgi:lambda family phage portal protein
MYGGARASRTTGYFGGNNTSADAELHHSLTTLRSRSRQMVRDSAYAKRAKAVVVNNVIGSGMGLQAQVENTRGEQADRVNTDIEHAWATWCRADSSHTGGTLHFGDLERAAMGEVFEAGEALLRLHFRAFGGSRVPLALELIEPERLAGDIDTHSVDPGNDLRMGVEVDRFFRPVAYWIRRHHVGDIRSRLTDYGNEVERVPAEQVFHMKLTTRWPQTRGEPWMHTVVRKIDDLDQYSQHEITAARASAAYFATIETPEDGSPNPLTTDTEADGTPLMDIEALTIQALAPGEKLAFHSPNRPNSAFDGFVRALLREIAAGVGTSYESLSRDYSQSNYSSSRLSLLDDRDGYRALQQWWIRSFREPLHRVWLQQAVLAGAIPAIPIGAYATDTLRYQAVRFKPRGWSWVDPTKEVTAYKEAIKAGLTTLTDVIAQTANGLDFEDVLATRKRELAMLDEAEVEVDTTVPEAIVPAAPQSIGQAADAEDDDADQAAGADASDDRARAARLVPLRRTA